MHKVTKGPGPAPIAPAVGGSRLRRRPSGEPPPLPRHIPASSRWYLAALAATVLLEAALAVRPARAVITRIDDAVVRGAASVRTAALVAVARAGQHLGDAVVPLVIGGVTVAMLLATARLRHLLTDLLAVLAAVLAASWLSSWQGRMRPAGVHILGDWAGYAHPSVPVATLAAVCAGAVYTSLPRGRWRRIGLAVAGAGLALLTGSRLLLGTDHPTDLLAALAIGWALPAVAFRLAAPDEAFPVVYRRGRRAHLDVGGERGEAIRHALDQQLGIRADTVEPFALGGSAGSTPLRVRTGDGSVFAKLYTVNHLRADRWYKLSRMIRYGRLEDEKPFNAVRRLVEYEDHLLRLLRDAGLPTPRPLGLVEITPEREYLVVMEFLDGAREIGSDPLSVQEIDAGLAVVRQLWQAGVAHRDIKPSNLLLRGGRVWLIDVAFATVRPTPWRQAVDLANMMLTLALASTPELVYERTLRIFAADDVAEAFAACRSVTIPSQLRARLRTDGRDLIGRFRALAPQRRPVPIQLWTLRRVAISLGVLAAVAAVALGLTVAINASTARPAAGAPACTSVERIALLAQAVPSTSYVPCLGELPQGWRSGALHARRGGVEFTLRSDRSPGLPVRIALAATCRSGNATPLEARTPGGRTAIGLTAIDPRYAGTLVDVFPGGCVTYRFDFPRGTHIALMAQLQQAVQFVSRAQLRLDVAHRLDVRLDP